MSELSIKEIDGLIQRLKKIRDYKITGERLRREACLSVDFNMKGADNFSMPESIRERFITDMYEFAESMADNEINEFDIRVSQIFNCDAE